MLETTPGAVTKVKGTWTVPAVSCLDASSGATFGIVVGIDGIDTDRYPNLAGVGIDCGSGILPECYAFYYLGGTGYILDTTIEPKDQVKVDLSWQQDHFEAIFNNTTETGLWREIAPAGLVLSGIRQNG